MKRGEMNWLVPVGAETVSMRINEQSKLEIFVAERPGGPVFVCTPLEGAMLALALQEATKVAGPAYAKTLPERVA